MPFRKASSQFAWMPRCHACQTSCTKAAWLHRCCMEEALAGTVGIGGSIRRYRSVLKEHLLAWKCHAFICLGWNVSVILVWCDLQKVIVNAAECRSSALYQNRTIQWYKLIIIWYLALMQILAKHPICLPHIEASDTRNPSTPTPAPDQ